jgi:formamidopyrimidine-DNA glycosylase
MMPELPEVHTVAMSLRNGGRGNLPIVGHVIEDVEVLWDKTVAAPDVVTFAGLLKNAPIEDVRRRGKFILFDLVSHTLLVHLRMSGDFLVLRDEDEMPAHARVIFTLSDGLRLVFNNPRKFGRMWLVVDENEVVGELGMEPFSEDFTSEWLFEELQKRKRQIKPLLMDQHFIAGLGNIYTDESLFLAKVHPLTIANEVSFAQVEKLQAAIQQTLQDSIERQGSSIDCMYKGGNFQDYFNVYQQTGMPCPICGTPIERMVVGQRGTHFCPSCQKIANE